MPRTVPAAPSTLRRALEAKPHSPAPAETPLLGALGLERAGGWGPGATLGGVGEWRVPFKLRRGLLCQAAGESPIEICYYPARECQPGKLKRLIFEPSFGTDIARGV